MTTGFDFSSPAYRDASIPDPAAFPEVYEGVVETQNRRHVEVLIAALNAAGFPTRLLLGAADDAG